VDAGPLHCARLQFVVGVALADSHVCIIARTRWGTLWREPEVARSATVLFIILLSTVSVTLQIRALHVASPGRGSRCTTRSSSHKRRVFKLQSRQTGGSVEGALGAVYDRRAALRSRVLNSEITAFSRSPFQNATKTDNSGGAHRAKSLWLCKILLLSKTQCGSLFNAFLSNKALSVFTGFSPAVVAASARSPRSR